MTAFSLVVLGTLLSLVSASWTTKQTLHTKESFRQVTTHNRLYESCPVRPRQSQLVGMNVKVDGAVKYRCETTGAEGQCSCKDEYVLLNSFYPEGIVQSCCSVDFNNPDASSHCSGCELFKEKCFNCLGGFTKIEDTCVRCSNVRSFIDLDGNSCANYVMNGWCANGMPTPGNEGRAQQKFNHISAQDACCSCGGGAQGATPFEYVVTRENGMGLLGQPFRAVPTPRTATEYFEQADCDLARYGLELDGSSGVITGTTQAEEPFLIECVVSARSPRVGSSIFKPFYLEYNATLRIEMSSIGLKSHDGKYTDAVVYDELSYKQKYSIAWGSYIPHDKAKFSMACSPRTFVEFDAKNGLLYVDASSVDEYADKFNSNHGGQHLLSSLDTPTGTETIVKSICTIIAKDNEGSVHTMMVKVFAYPPTQKGREIGYSPASAVRMTVGQPLVEPLKFGYLRDVDKTLNETASDPIEGQYSINVACDSDIRFKPIYNVATGHVTILGLPVFAINPITGDISGSPHVGLRDLMDASMVRSSFRLSCDIYAAIASSIAPPQTRMLKATRQLVVQVDSDSCWVNIEEYSFQNNYFAMLNLKSKIDKIKSIDCKVKCEKSKACAGFNWVPLTDAGYSLGVCYELVVVPTNVALSSGLKIKTGGYAKMKVPNCQLHQTCVGVSVTDHAYLSGIYCPVTTGTQTVAQPVYQKSGFHPDDSFLLEPFDKYHADPMPTGCTVENTAWVIRKASLHGNDVIDVENGYVETHGEIEACLHSDVLNGPANPGPMGATMTLKSGNSTTFLSLQQNITEVFPREYYDSIPFSNSDAHVRGEDELPSPSSHSRGGSVLINMAPAGKGCTSPIEKEDPEKDKSSDKDEAGNEEKTEKEAQTAESGLIKGIEEAVTSDIKALIFKFDDPSTIVTDDYHLHHCQCFFEEWGDELPVTEESFEKASAGALKVGSSFNSFQPDPLLLWTGPYLCDQRFMLSQSFTSVSCHLDCMDNEECHYYSEVQSDLGSACLLYSDCEQMTRATGEVVSSTHGVHRAKEQLCHIADPEECHALSGRRRMVTGQDDGFGTCLWQHLMDQCDYNKLMGDGHIEECAVCTYKYVSAQERKRSMPDFFPHGSQLTASCLQDRYSLLKQKETDGTVTCIDGEWRDSIGQVGLANLQCAGCVQVFKKSTKAVEMQSASLEELIFLGRRKMGMFYVGHGTFPTWIETEGEANTVSLTTADRPQIGRFAWKVALDGVAALQLEANAGSKCLAVKDYIIGTSGLLDVVSLERCQFDSVKTVSNTNEIEVMDAHSRKLLSIKQPQAVIELETSNSESAFSKTLAQKGPPPRPPPRPTKKPTNFPTQFPSSQPTRFPTFYPTGESNIIITPLQVLSRIGAQEPIVDSNTWNRGWSCNEQYGFLTSLEWSGKCTKKTTVSKARTNKVLADIFGEAVTVACKPGEAMRSLWEDSGVYHGNCVPMPAMGKCVDTRFKHKKATNFDPITSAKHAKAKCEPHMVVSRFQAEWDGPTKTVNLILSCCGYSSFSGYTISPEQLYGFEDYEGTYCPVGYDDLLRPQFVQKTSYGRTKLRGKTIEEPKAKGDTEFEKVLTGKWHRHHPHYHRPHTHTPYPTRFPTKFPSSQPTTFPTLHPTAFPTPYPTKIAEVDPGQIEFDETTNKWCLIKSSGVSTCTPEANLEHPLQVNWLAAGSAGTDFAVLGFTDMKGEGMAASAFGAAGGNAPPPKKPELVKFEAIQPEYSQGCLAMEENAFEEAEEAFEETTPCGLVARFDWKEDNKVEKGPGLDYASLNECFERVGNKETAEARREGQGELKEMGFKFATEVAKTACSMIPDITTGGGGGLAGPFFAAVLPTKDTCDEAIEFAGTADEVVSKIKKVRKLFKLINMEDQECDPMQGSILRILCDLHCVQDAVKVGTQTIISNIEALASNLIENTDMLMDYYGQLTMNKVETEVAKLKPKKSLLSDDSRSAMKVIGQFNDTIREYMEIGRSSLLDKSGLPHAEAAAAIESSYQQAAKILSQTHGAVITATDSNKAIEALASGLIRIDSTLSIAHNTAAFKAQSEGGNGDFMRDNIRVNAAHLNRSFQAKNLLLQIQKARTKRFDERGEAIFHGAISPTGHSQSTSAGILNLKLDRLSLQVEKLTENADRTELRNNIKELSSHWEKMRHMVNSYISAANTDLNAGQHALIKVDDYLNCGSDSSFIRKVTHKVHKAMKAAQLELRQTWPKALDLLEEHHHTMSFGSISERMIAAAADDVKLSTESPLTAHLSREGLVKIRSQLVEKVDGMPREMFNQALSMLHQTRFFHVRMTQDGGVLPTNDESARLLASFDSLVDIYADSLWQVANKNATSAMMINILHNELVRSHAAPAICKDLAFQTYHEPNTASLVTLDTVNGVQIISHLPIKLMTKLDDFRVIASKGGSIADQSIASFVDSVYACENKGDSWKLKKASEISNDIIIAFCRGSLCQSGDIKIGSVLDMNLKDTNLFTMFSDFQKLQQSQE